MKERPKVNSEGQKELDKAEMQLAAFENSVKELTKDRMDATAKPEETEPQTKLALRDIDKMTDAYIRPSRSISTREKFNERYRAEYDAAKEWVQIIAEHNEIKGETLEFWTKPFPGMPAEFWQIPTGRPVYVHKYVNDRIKSCYYHRLKTVDRPTNVDGGHTFYGSMVADSTIQRIDSREVPKHRTISYAVSR